MTTKQIDYIYDYIRREFTNIFAEWRDLIIFVNNIYEDVVEDIDTTADWSGFDEDEVCENDIDISVSRVLLKLVGEE